MPRALIVASALAVGLTAGATPAEASCADMQAPFAISAKEAVKRPITARDLIELRDIGDTNSAIYGAPSRLAVSPDGRYIAFSLVRADLASNGYCLAIYVTAIDASAAPRLVASGGEYRMETGTLRGYQSAAGGLWATVPSWSPDGKRVAYLRRDGGVTQAWTADVDGTGSRQVSHASGDVNMVGWSGDGQRLLYSTRPADIAERAAIDREADTGWLYDARVFASYDLRPLVAGDHPRVVYAVPARGGKDALASADDSRALTPDADPGWPAAPQAVAADGRRAWTERAGGGVQTALQLFVTDAAGRKIACTADWCQGGIVGLWWAADGRTLLVQRREGWNKERVTFYRWTPGAVKPRSLLSSTDTIQDCLTISGGLVCTRENATTPRQIVRVDGRSGRSTTIVDPNPGFSAIALGSVRRLKATNAYGLPSWADLVLPPGYQAGTKLPLVVVQYQSQGFLRGGTGNEYPIFLLAARGFAVLSFERPPFAAAATPKVISTFDLNRTELKNWAERRNNLSSLLAELDLAVATGTVDDMRVGITGLSDGSSTVRFAMINSQRFAAAAISTCCFDPAAVIVSSGPALSNYLQKMGFPSLTHPDHDFWKDYSLAVSGDRTNTPLLMMLADREASSSLETFEAMREFGKPIESYIFPDEYHIKWQPLHRLAVYNRAIDWFAFWLQGTEDPDPAKRAQYARWRAMRAARDKPDVKP